MNYAINNFLEQIGLTKKEIDVYQSLLQTGEVPIAKLAVISGTHRVATYALIEQLKKKGLISITESPQGKRVAARPPKAIESLLRKERRMLRRLQERYEDVLPELNSLFSQSSARPKVQFYEGIAGLEQIHVDIIDTLKELPQKERITYSYSNPSTVDSAFQEYVYGEGDYIDKRQTHGILNKVICPDVPMARKLSDDPDGFLLDMIILPLASFPYKNDITIYHNKMAIESMQHDAIGVLIESSDIINDQKAIFQLAWAGAKHIGKHYATTHSNTIWNN